LQPRAGVQALRPYLYGDAIDEGVDRSISIGAHVLNMSFVCNEPGARGVGDVPFAVERARAGTQET
jgi:hypothetical protein